MNRGSATGVAGLVLAGIPWAIIGVMEWLQPD